MGYLGFRGLGYLGFRVDGCLGLVGAYYRYRLSRISRAVGRLCSGQGSEFGVEIVGIAT